ncbi:succinate-semialdehyde dehydrogenase/glutarate-semialdehyde dehydrogenase [Rhizobium leguminosarum]|uniref:NAD-dependent succinate-semialdehyde dehydrogenase n=1 Tax=Rhizobium leguminosarum TaxID=384 RepID=UPI00161628B2|nr:NAD-dependent succinate-semialdehyde dehydrogenase [Rhizobium leguminosarum]MBB5667505.1 succinate-semialdehyde dehydrogenase/glutarate-semialdehyde dehydrogenase [Rhizobium leguminosarum]
MIVTTNPATGDRLAAYDLHDDAYVEQALAAAAGAQKIWRKHPVEERVHLLRNIAKTLRAGKSRYAEMVTREMGKPIVEAEAEIEKCAYNCDFYAEHAADYLADETLVSNASQSAVVFDPLGVVLAIMPWNYPFWQFFRFAAPAFAAGNGAILKHANNVPECALAIEEIMREAGCPEGLFATVLIEPSKVAAIIADDRIAAVTLTGSTEVGAIVASQAGKALKKQVLELGGSDPFIVLADADLEEAATVAVKARYINVGQSCVNAKRFIVEESIADRFVELFCAKVAALKIGDPMVRDTNIGPMARENLMTGLHAQVEKTVAAGAKLMAGGKPLDRAGFYYAPTVLDHVRPDMAAFCEETFGPVAAIIRVKDAVEAVRLANQTEYGLGSAIWSRDIERARQLAREIDAGAVFINGMVASDPHYPFGGIKRSGYGRELGVYGIREFVNIKTVWIGPAVAAEPAKTIAEKADVQ